MFQFCRAVLFHSERLTSQRRDKILLISLLCLFLVDTINVCKRAAFCTLRFADYRVEKILTPTYKKLYSSQEEFTDSILKRVNNLSLLNSGRLHHVDIAKQYVFTFVYYLVDCDE